jgi:Zn-dependent protease with chaperone function
MFETRCIGVSFSSFFLIYSVLSAGVCLGWNFFGHRMRGWRANLLFAIRMMPLAMSAFITLGFIVPSFLLLEPRSIVEPVGSALFTLGLGCLCFLLLGISRTVSAQVKTSQALAAWLRGASRIRASTRMPVFRTHTDLPAVTVSGLWKPRVLVSEAALAILTPAELRSALRHEAAHVRYFDNLKKLLFRFSIFPGMARLESAWSDAAEMAADAAAVSSIKDALDLAAALIKLSKLGPMRPIPQLSTALLSSPDSLPLRLARLFAWEKPRSEDRRYRHLYILLFAILSICIVSGYPDLLVRVHAVTEWLVQ